MTDPDYQKRESEAVSSIKAAIPGSLKQDMLPECKGLFAELYANKAFPDHFMACGVDGVGTKLLVADAMERYDTVGIDLVAMSANDIATMGQVSPFLFIDYLAVQEKISEKAGEIMKGIVKGLEQCETGQIMKNDIHINLGKGETASVDELLSSFRPGYAFDLAGAIIGFIKRSKLNLTVKQGDAIIALKSSGPHSNGYTDLRHTLLKGDFETRPEFKKNYTGRFRLDDVHEGRSIGDWLLEPTRIYTQTVAKIAERCRMVGINNTGYGLKNLNRNKGPFEFRITDPIEPQPIFQLTQEEAGYTDEEMYRKFNMGQGFFIIADQADTDEILNIAKAEDAKVVGEVRKADKERTVLEKDGKEIVFSGY